MRWLRLCRTVPDPSLVSAHIGADHEGAAALQMKEVCEALGGKGKIAIIDGVMGSTGQIQLTAGYESVLKDFILRSRWI